jgi:hypothetical protein|tara:strand:+ start:1080 stop:1217 length:138 start_codon:yes stop_codon:yes gene_type:complete
MVRFNVALAKLTIFLFVIKSPRWTYSEANASRWRPLFDDLLKVDP